MDIDVELDIKRQLAEAAKLAAGLENEAARTRIEAEETLADAAVWAYNQDAPVASIANWLGVNRQRVYMLLALKGIRPGKEVITND